METGGFRHFNDPGRRELLLRRNRSPFGSLFALIGTLIVLCFLFVGAWYFFIGFVAVKLVDKVQEDGLKTVVEEVWEGKNANQDG